MKTFYYSSGYDCYGNVVNLQRVFDKFVEEGFNPEDFPKIKVELDWSGCYYPGESPDIGFKYEE